MRDRRGVEHGIARRHGVDVGVVAERHHEQIAVGERRPLGAPRGATGVEQPGGVVGPSIDERHRLRSGEPIPPITGGDDNGPQRVDGVEQRMEAVGMVVVGDGDGSPVVVENVGDLVAMESGVDRNRHHSGVPDAEQRFQVLGPVAHHDRDPIAGGEIVFVAEPGRSGSGPLGEGGPVGMDALALGESRFVRSAAPLPLDPGGKVHRLFLSTLCAVTPPNVLLPVVGGHTGGDAHDRNPSAVRLTDQEALARLTAHDHGVLCTLHTERGVDAVPCVFAADGDGFVAIPIDTVKPKASSRLQRERNLESDPRATLLVDRWDGDDWTKLWWVRVELRWEPEPPPDRIDALTAALVGRYRQYRERPFARILVLRVVGISGWSAADR